MGVGPAMGMEQFSDWHLQWEMWQSGGSAKLQSTRRGFAKPKGEPSEVAQVPQEPRYTEPGKEGKYRWVGSRRQDQGDHPKHLLGWEIHLLSLLRCNWPNLKGLGQGSMCVQRRLFP